MTGEPTRPSLSPEVRRKASMFLTSTLRHRPGDLPMDRGGYVPVGPLLAQMVSRGLIADADQFLELVVGDDKGRFEFSPKSHDEDGAVVLEGGAVRACSGHSLDVVLDLDRYVPIGPLFFGTVIAAAEWIEHEGLVRSYKRHVRLLEDAAAATEVARKRGGSGPAVFRVDAERMLADGHAFLRANNGEVLVPRVPVEYVERVVLSHVAAPEE